MKISIPTIGMTFSRDLMPQVNNPKTLLASLDKKDIAYRNEKVDPNKLKSTQSEFDKDKIANMMLEPNLDGIIISNDNYVLDGHHRWIAAYNKGIHINATRVDLPILDLMHHAKTSEIYECVKSVLRSAARLADYK